MNKKRVFSGIRSSGRLHIGNYLGAVKGMLELQENHDCIFGVVDYHGITTPFDPKMMQKKIRGVVLDYLAAGLDPKKCHLMIQSQVPEHVELSYLFATIFPVSRLEQLPTYKDKKLENPAYVNLGLLYYPILMAADILLYKAESVPVGKDQLPHIELTREVARRFNNIYGNVFPEPDVLLTKFAVVPGIDGRKMSKSYNNDIAIADSPEETEKKVLKMITDPQKIYKGDKGRPEICPVYSLHQIYNPKYQEIHRGCSSGELGCVDCKKMLASHINSNLAPIRAKRKELEKSPDKVKQVLENGEKRARARAQATMQDVRKAMKLE